MGSNAKTDVAAAAYATPRVGTRLLLATNFKLFLSSTSQTPRPTNLSRWPCRLPGHRQADHDGLGQPSGSHGGALELEKTVNQSPRSGSTSTRWPGTRATVACATSSSPS